MYQEFFKLKEMPFSLEPNPRFIVLGDDHEEALATLIYAIEQQEGWALLLGAPGVGKTTLIIALLREVGERVLAGVITNPRLEPLDFFNLVALELGMDGPFKTKGQFLLAMGELIKRCRQEGRALLLVVDEAQSLTAEMLEELRLLGNLDDGSPRVLNIFLVGQPELLYLLKRSRGLMQRLRRYYLLKNMDLETTRAYIRHRLKTAGGDPDIFDQGAVEAVHQLTKGNCRLVNSLCDSAMLLAFSKEQRRITRRIVEQAAAEDVLVNYPGLKKKGAAKAAKPASSAPAAPAAPARPAPPAEPRPSPPAAKAAAPEAGQEAEAGNGARRTLRERRQAASAARRQRPAAQGGVLDVADELLGETVSSVGAGAHPAREPRTSRRTMSRARPARRGWGSRLARSLSRDTPGSLWRRLVVLLLVLLLLGGIYFFSVAGGVNYLRSIWWRLKGGKTAVLVVPEDTLPETAGRQTRPQPGIRDWGPVVPAPAAPPASRKEGVHG